MIGFTLLFLVLSDSAIGSLFSYPKSHKIIETLMPETGWTSICECPMRYYDHGFEGEVAPLNGKPVIEGEFAHMAAIGWIDAESGSVSWNCGGSLISEDVVITAAHCAAWKGQRPSVVRLGDLDLSDDSDNEHVQEFSVQDIIVHPNYTSRLHYDDVALVRLNGTVRLHEAVTPACLWTFPYVKFPLLEACGYGQTSYLGTPTPRLLKVELSPVPIQECNEYYEENRKLPNGIRDTQFCAIDSSEGGMDLCLGDSGGPIQIKLLANGRMSPFIIGVTSFGRACGDKTPGAYSRISSYVDWIEKELRMSFDPHQCARRYAKYREFENDIIREKKKRKLGYWANYDTTMAHVDVYTNNANHRVTLVKEDGEALSRRCGAVILTETFVLTLSDCVAQDVNGKPSLKVQVDAATTIKVKSIFQRPLNGEKPHYDIALLELVQPIEFSNTIHPVCLWPDDHIPDDMDLEINGYGPRDYHNVYLDDPQLGFGHVSVRAKMFNETTRCQDAHHLCYGVEKLHLLPETCELDIGGPLERKYFPFTYKFFPYVMGINAYGEDCGFGQPSVSVKVSNAIDWIDSIIFARSKTEEEPKNLLPRVKRNLQELKAYNESHRFELEDCPHIYERYRKKSGQKFLYDDMPIYQHVALILNRNFYQPCHGVLITNQHVLASYSCLYNPRNHPFEFTPEFVEVHTYLREIAEVKHHENRTTLIKMNATIDLSFNVVPACLWLERDATPFELTIIRPSYEEHEPSYIPVRPYQNNICKTLRNDTETTQKLLERENYGCLSFTYGKSSCDFEDNRVIVQAIRNISETIVPFIVGVIDTNADCQEDKPIIYARIAYDIEWIRENL